MLVQLAWFATEPTGVHVNVYMCHDKYINIYGLNSCVSLAALQSVFPHTELGTFLSLAKRDKERQLKELTMIVTGIRLFNKDCGKGGEGIDDCKYSGDNIYCKCSVTLIFLTLLHTST